MDEPQKPDAERSQTQKAMCCMSPFTWNIQSRSVHRDGKQRSGCQGLGEREWGLSAWDFPLGWWECCGTGWSARCMWLYNTVDTLNATELYTLKWLILCCVRFTLTNTHTHTHAHTHIPESTETLQKPHILGTWKVGAKILFNMGISWVQEF